MILLPTKMLWAQQIQALNGKKAIVNLGSTPAKVGDKFYALTATGKKSAILVVKQVKGNKALMLVEKGNASKGMSVQSASPLAGKSTPSQSTPPQVTPPEPSQTTPTTSKPTAADAQPKTAMDDDFGSHRFKKKEPTKNAIGVYLGMAMNSMTIRSAKIENNTTYVDDLTLTGNSFGVKGFYDYAPNSDFTIRFIAGYEPFEVKGEPTAGKETLCGGTPDCNIKFQYLTGELHAHYNFLTGRTRVWVGAGAAMMFAPSNSSTVAGFDDSVKTNQVITGSVGADIGVGKTSFIPLAFEYGYYPTSGEVKATGMFLRVGFGKTM